MSKICESPERHHRFKKIKNRRRTTFFPAQSTVIPSSHLITKTKRFKEVHKRIRASEELFEYIFRISESEGGVAECKLWLASSTLSGAGLSRIVVELLVEVALGSWCSSLRIPTISVVVAVATVAGRFIQTILATYIINLPLFFIRQNLVGFGQLLKFFCSFFLTIGIFVWMPLSSQFFVSLLYIGLAGISI